MISFECDYCNGAHPKILERLIQTNSLQTLTYGNDEFSLSAKEKIKQLCANQNINIFLLSGGTQTNSTVIDSILRNYEGVISSDCGHINVHESGAIESCRHKIIILKNHYGKLLSSDLQEYLQNFHNDETCAHMVQPGMVYITFPTEWGTIYSLKELTDLHNVCKEYNIPLFLDGARLGYGLMAHGNDVTIGDICRLTDVFYIGGTKIGALYGEAVVFTHGNADRHFFTIQKQHGAVMAKSRFLGIQFDTLFTDNLYFDISKHAIAMAMKLKDIFKNKGYKFYIDSPTNQQFIIISDNIVRRLKNDFVFSHIAPYDKKNTICRFVTSWATTEEQIKELEAKI